jgi:hypothetical protein
VRNHRLLKETRQIQKEMKEYMFLIRNTGEGKAALSPVEQKEFLEKCRLYIEQLKKAGKLIAAQPLIREGIILTGVAGTLKETTFDQNKEIQVGYYHILADDLEEAVAIAKGNPEFEYGSTASIEVRPVKMKESDTGFVYPKAS